MALASPFAIFTTSISPTIATAFSKDDSSSWSNENKDYECSKVFEVSLPP